jgi:hypothetical protein
MAVKGTKSEGRAEDLRLQLQKEYENNDRLISERLSCSEEFAQSVIVGDADRVEDVKARISAIREEIDKSYDRIRYLFSELEALSGSPTQD